MTVTSSTARIAYTGNSSTTAFSVPFYFLLASDLKVYVGSALQSISTHYTVSGANDPAGGTVTFLSAPANLASVVILRDPPQTQTTDYQDNDTFPAASHERALDKLTMLVQRLLSLISRSFTLPDSYAGSASTTLPVPEADKFLTWNGSATALVNRDITDLSSVLAYSNWRTDIFNGGGTTFTLAADPGSVHNTDVSISGVTQVPGVDYTLSGTALTFGSATPSGTGNVVVRYGQALPVGMANASMVIFSAAGSGAVSRTAEKKLQEELSAEDYGAVGDGGIDDTAGMHAALSAAVAQGKPLRLRSGATYLLNTWVAFSNSGPLKIEGNGATIKGPSTTVDFLSPASNFDIEGVVFDRWNSVVERLLAATGTFTRVRFVGNTIKNCDGQTFNIERPISNYWIEGNTWDTCTGGYAIKIGENTYANQDNYIKGTISRNTFKSLSASGSTSCAAMLVYGREVTIEGNIVDGVQGAAGEGWGIYTKTRYATIRGNLLRNINSTSASDVVGLNVKGVGRAVTASPQGFSVVVSGNQVYNVGTSNIKGIGIRVQTDDVMTVANIIEDAGLIGISVDDSAGSYDHVVADNKIRFSVATGTIGISIDCNGARIANNANVVRNAETGIRVYPVGGAISDAQVTDNILNVTSVGISMTHNEDINDLIVARNVVDAGANGIVDNGGAGLVSRLRVIDNDFSRTTTQFNGSFSIGSLVHESRVQTSDATITTALGITFADESAHIVEAQIVGRRSDTGARAMYWKRALVYRDGAGAVIQGSVQDVAADVESDAAWDAVIAVSGNSALARVTGVAATNVNWRVKMQIIGA